MTEAVRHGIEESASALSLSQRYPLPTNTARISSIPDDPVRMSYVSNVFDSPGRDLPRSSILSRGPTWFELNGTGCASDGSISAM